MKILLLGGTVFLGRALTDAALSAGHHVTHFNRGSARDARVETLVGDRTDSTIAATLAARRFDAVIDTSGYLPQVVKRSVDALRGAAACYLFVSSISAYPGEGPGECYAEDAPLKPPVDPLPDGMTPATYGNLKAMCEAVVREGFGGGALIVRPGLIVGPHDPTDRFTYWPARVARGGIVVAPGAPDRFIQFIDVRDLSEWMIRALEGGIRGTFNANGPRHSVTMSALLESCRAISGSDARFQWLDDERLAEAKVGAWSEMPLWLPASDPHAAGFMDVPIDRALAAGLRFRPLAETIADTLAWSRSRPASHPWKAGPTEARERTLLD
jgi:2'-hydroxyisoflavone reductase